MRWRKIRREQNSLRAIIKYPTTSPISVAIVARFLRRSKYANRFHCLLSLDDSRHGMCEHDDRDQRGDMQLSFIIDGGRETDAPARGWNDEAARHNRVADALTDHLDR